MSKTPSTSRRSISSLSTQERVPATGSRASQSPQPNHGLEQATHIASRIIAVTPWADISNALLGAEINLTLLMEATCDDFATWLDEAEAAGYDDELSLTERDLNGMSDDLRRGYVARLIRNVALDFGIGTEFSGAIGERREDRDALAPLLRKLCELAHDSEERLSDGLVTPAGHTVGGTAKLAELDGDGIGQLPGEGMIEIGDDGQWAFSKRGAAFSWLLSEYADPTRHLRSSSRRHALTDLFEAERNEAEL